MGPTSFCYFPPNLQYLRPCSQTVAQEVINVARWIPQLWRKHHNKSTQAQARIPGQYEKERKKNLACLVLKKNNQED